MPMTMPQSARGMAVGVMRFPAMGILQKIQHLPEDESPHFTSIFTQSLPFLIPIFTVRAHPQFKNQA